MFQSAPGAKAGGNAGKPVPWRSCSRFNPPPARRPGGTRSSRPAPFSIPSFNPPPARRPGGTRVGMGQGARHDVSIRPRREGRGEPGDTFAADFFSNVSIRPRREGRGEPLAPLRSSDPSLSFNPPPARRPGGTSRAGELVGHVRVSIRPRREGRGERRATPCNALPQEVSIRPRREGRGERTYLLSNTANGAVSIRPRREGRGEQNPVPAVTEIMLFQSAPGAKAGGNALSINWRLIDFCLNPPPARRPGGTLGAFNSGAQYKVSIRPRREGRGEPEAVR